MAILKVFYKGALVSNFTLDGLKECKVGRDASADISLQHDESVSRHHLSIKWIDGGWVVECVARSQLLFKDGHQISSFRLNHGDRFQIPSYEFEYLSDSDSNTVNESQTPLEDKTALGFLPSIPTLVKYDSNGQVIDTITMSGSAWIIGRDPNNSIFIDHPKLSRKHFEILRKEGRFYIRDLGSANGTFVNGKSIAQNDYTNLFSGDEISVFDLKLRFVLRDASFDNRVQQAQNFLSPFDSNQGAINSGVDESQTYQKSDHLGANPNSNSSDFTSVPKAKKKLTPIRAAIALILVLASVLYFLLYDTQSGSNTSDSGKILSPFDKLTPEQQATVKQLYQSAQNFLQQGKYELARQEIIKLHQIIPFYEDSKQIEETANQGIAMLQERERVEAEAREREIIQEKIKTQIAKCRSILNPKIEMFEMDLCLAPVLEFDPTHPEIVALKAEAQRLVEERAVKDQQRRQYAEKVERLKRMFDEAQKLDQNQEWLKAIASYDKVVTSKLPDSNNIKMRAKSRSEELQQMLLAKQSELEQKADEAFKRGDLKTAIKIIREAILINAENQVILGKHEEWMSELRKSMMPIYQDSILEESVGEVESAKLKWQKIRDLSLPGEDYYEKAKVKLKKYGFWK
jgi:pSer/pThr/pTyr-binding forkhead associated (FHA) protein/tetratricopeptide (TPR) repeat protein